MVLATLDSIFKTKSTATVFSFTQMDQNMKVKHNAVARISVTERHVSAAPIILGDGEECIILRR